MKRLDFVILILPFLLAACHEEPDFDVPMNLQDKRGIYIACEGNFLYGNASLSFYDKDTKEVYNQIFYARNQAPLGDVAQTLALKGDLLFVVVNNSGKIVVADKNTLDFKGSITDLLSPRAIHFVNSSKAYISDMLARKITVVNPGTMRMTGTIGVSDGKTGGTGHSTENFVQWSHYAYVTCWVSDNKVLVIDTRTDAVIDSVQVPSQPNKIMVDCNSKIWIQSDGEYYSATGEPEKPALVRIDPVSKKIEKIFYLAKPGSFFADVRLTPDKDSLVYIAGDLYKMPVDADHLPEQGFILSNERFLYSLAIDPESGEIYLGDPIDYTQNGLVYRYSPGGALVDSFRVGVSPGDFLFNF